MDKEEIIETLHDVSIREIIEKYFDSHHDEIIKLLRDLNVDLSVFQYDGCYLDQHYHSYLFSFKNDNERHDCEIMLYKSGNIYVEVTIRKEGSYNGRTKDKT